MSTVPIHEDPMFRNLTAQRFGCLARMAIMGLVSVALVVALGFWLVKDTERDPELVGARFSDHFSADIPDHFYPYTYSKFFGSYLIVYWSNAHMLDENRTSSVFGLHWRSKWQELSVADVEAEALAELEQRLDRNEFRTTHYEAVEVTYQGQTVKVHRFRGLSRIDDSFAEAITCYRYLQGPDGPVQVMTLGLAENFPEDDQLDLVASVRLKDDVAVQQETQP